MGSCEQLGIWRREVSTGIFLFCTQISNTLSTIAQRAQFYHRLTTDSRIQSTSALSGGTLCLQKSIVGGGSSGNETTKYEVKGGKGGQESESSRGSEDGGSADEYVSALGG